MLREESKEEDEAETLVPVLRQFRVPRGKVGSEHMRFLYGQRSPTELSYVGIWPPALECWTLLHFGLLGKAHKVQALAMVASATSRHGLLRARQYATRRGVPEHVVERVPHERVVDDKDVALCVGRCLVNGRKPSSSLAPASVLESAVLAAALEGYASKVSEAVGFSEDDDDPPDEVTTPKGAHVIPDDAVSHRKRRSKSTGGFVSSLRAARRLPAERRRAFADVPVDANLEEHVGYAFSEILDPLTSKTARSAIAAAIRDTFCDGKDLDDSPKLILPVPVKVAASVIYARLAGNKALETAFAKIAERFEVPLAMARKIADAPMSDVRARLAGESCSATTYYLVLARAVGASPVDLPTFRNVPGSDPRAIVDLVHVVALAQLLHRLFTALAP